MTQTARNLKSVSNEVETALYEVRRKIYPRAVHGWFAGWRVALVIATQVVFYGLPWLVWNGRQAVLFDLAARKFYIFGLVFWPQDFIFLTALLVISAFALFLFTALAGRLFCGYACPQTVYTEIFMWIERWIEGGRLQRMRLDKQQAGPRKIALKSVKHALWIAVALWTGFTFVGYFTPIHTLLAKAGTLTLGPWETFWTLFYGFATYGNAGWMREQVCKYMCPYARFQAVMFDAHTLVITYDARRGEPRGARSRSADAKALGLGDCVNCEICVQVCPTGIDIRNGLQYECTGCGACIDGCNQVMDKLGYARGLIRYSTENAMREGFGPAGILRRMRRPRIAIYSGLLVAAALALAAGLYLRTPLKVDVIRDRAALARETREGLIENVYRLQIMNTHEERRRFVITARGPESLTVVIKQPVEVRGTSTEAVPVALRVDPAVVAQGAYDVVFHIEAVDDPAVSTNEKSRFFVR
ncbi:MAG: cytochrome c oxidase accessory protein CcoG [Burkholderiales bacterium]